MTAYNEYQMNINTNEYYKISKKDFVKWLEESGEKNFFKNMIEADELNIEEWYDIAVDYSIPFIMIKWFKRKGF